MKTLLILALLIFTASAAHVFLTAPPKEVSDSPSGALIFEEVKSVTIGLNGTVSGVSPKINPMNSTVWVQQVVNVTLPTNPAAPYNLNLTLNYGFPYSDTDNLDQAVVTLDLSAANLQALNNSVNLSLPTSGAVAWANLTITKNVNSTILGTLTLVLNVKNETDQAFNVLITALNFTRSWQTVVSPQLVAPWSQCWVNTTENETSSTTGVELQLDLSKMTGNVTLNHSLINVSWVNSTASGLQIVPLTFKTSYGWAGTVGTNSTVNVTQVVNVSLTDVNASTITWPESNITTIAVNPVNASLVKNLSLVVSRSWDNNTNLTSYDLQNFTLTGIQNPPSLNETAQRNNNSATVVSAEIQYGKSSQTATLVGSGSNFGVAFTNNANGKNAVVFSGTRNTNVTFWVNFVVNETYQDGNSSVSVPLTLNLSSLAGQIGDFSAQGTSGVFSVPFSFPYNTNTNQGGENDVFNVSFVVQNQTNNNEPYFLGWKFNLLNLTVSQQLSQGENAMAGPLMAVNISTGDPQPSNLLDQFTSACTSTSSQKTVNCVLSSMTTNPVQYVLQNVDNGTNSTQGPVNFTIDSTGLNVSYIFSSVSTLVPKVTVQWSVQALSNTTVKCATNSTTNDPVLASVTVCGQWAYNISSNATHLNRTVLSVTNVSLVYNSWQDYSSRANLTQSSLTTLGVVVQNNSISNKSLTQKSNDTQIFVGLPDNVFLVSNQTDKVKQNLNLSLAWIFATTYQYDTMSTNKLQVSNGSNVTTKSVTSNETLAYQLVMLQQIMNDSVVTQASNQDTQFITQLYNITVPWTVPSDSNQGYGAAFVTFSLGYGAVGFQEMTAPSSGLSGGAIAGIVIGCIAFIAILGVVIYCVTKKKDQDFYTKQNA